MTEPSIKQLAISGSGPITALDLIDWFSDCEQAFKQWEFYQNRILPDDQKIIAVGKAIKNEGPTKHIYDWYISQTIPASQTFQQFQANLFKAALGDRWGMEILKEFHTNSQGYRTSDEYVHSSQKLAHAVDTIGLPVPKLSPIEQKAHLLFNADPGILAAILKNDLNDQYKFTQASKQKIEQLLADYEGSKTGPTVVPDPTNSGTKAPISLDHALYMLTGISGYHSPNYFSDTTFLPCIDKAPRVVRVTASGVLPIIQQYSVQYSDSTVTAPSYISRVPQPGAQILDFALGPTEYLKTFKVQHGGGYVSALCFVTSENREYYLGGDIYTAWKSAFNAPDGWGIVGFHTYYGHFEDKRPFYNAMGCIFGRI